MKSMQMHKRGGGARGATGLRGARGLGRGLGWGLGVKAGLALGLGVGLGWGVVGASGQPIEGLVMEPEVFFSPSVFDEGLLDVELPTIESVVEGMASVNNNLSKDEPTLFEVYRDEDRLFAAVPVTLLDSPWLLGATMTAGPMLSGEQIGTELVEWRRKGPMLMLYRPEVRYTSDREPALADGVKRVFTDRYVLSAPIMAESGGRVLIDLGGLLAGQAPELVGVLGMIDPTAARVEKTKAFAGNVEVAISAPSQFWWTAGQLTTLHFSFSALPQDPYSFERRPADQRVGYWVHALRDIGGRGPLEGNFDRAIERWRLAKAFPGAAMSPPERPIVFYIEKTVPQAYRLYVRRGIEAWNEAFRGIGIENAIEVRQQTETQHADIDPEDVRYNFVRWVPTGAGYAIALHRTDPRTGEILDADVVIDDGWINAFVDEAPLFLPAGAEEKVGAMRRGGYGPAAERASARLGLRPVGPEGVARAGDRGGAGGAGGGVERLTPAEFGALSPPAKRARIDELTRTADLGLLGESMRHRRACAYGPGLGARLALGQVVLMGGVDDAGDDKGEGGTRGPMLNGVPEALIGDNLVALVAHEVGHVLGLRHNFAGSSWKPASAIEGYRSATDEPPSASVMDYVGTFLPQSGGREGPYNAVRVGPYDRWAIAYGYMEADGERLRAHLSESSDPAHRYLTDEDTYGLDPRAMRYDFGSDPVEGRLRELGIIDRARGRLLESLAKEGEGYGRVFDAYQRLAFMELFSLWDTTGWIGGSYRSRDHRGEGANPPLAEIDGDRQRDVLEMLIERVFDEKSFESDRELLAAAQPAKWYMPSFGQYGFGAESFDVYGMANLAQSLVLGDLMLLSGPRLIDQELRVDPESDALTAAELYGLVTEAVWSEFEGEPGRQAGRATNLKPLVSGLRRGLQREHAELLIEVGYRIPPYFMTPQLRQLQTLAIVQLREIRGRLMSWMAAGRMDDYTGAHIVELESMIGAALESSVSRAP